MFDILIAGEINPDLILSGDVAPAFGQVEKLVDSAVLTIGSSAAIFACGAARLGLKVAFIGVCGEDVFGRFMLTEMEKREVDVSNVLLRRPGQTGLSVILNQVSDRAILTYPGLMSTLRAADVSESLLRRCRHLHVTSYFLQTALQPDLPALFQRARALGLTISLDCNYDPAETWAGIGDLLPLVDVFLPNEREALALARSASVEGALEQLSRLAKTVAVKIGAQGAVACCAGETARAPAIPVKVVDTVGAGDAFDAGFLFGWLKDWPLEKSLRLACACGALSTQSAGGTAAQPTLAQALKYART